IVVIEQADPFVTKYRPQLEKYVAGPSKTGVLILEVRTFPATTKLAKSLPESAVIACKAPTDAKLPAWTADWSAARHGKPLRPAEPAGDVADRRDGPGQGAELRGRPHGHRTTDAAPGLAAAGEALRLAAGGRRRPEGW